MYVNPRIQIQVDSLLLKSKFWIRLSRLQMSTDPALMTRTFSPVVLHFTSI
ncbi:hypothetical protein HOLleu_38106 [Holothuria leucospilota]|uniref:Uncharacterized protein n=1 Tax=Holothuria leucospilota TaxID=206669 RepID=A0A9Q0YMR6_HOLLE|nr:hypothetical protein HOLleu_38106 [Holothuria leucospilota]